MGLIKFSDSNDYKCNVLKSIGITVSNYNVQKGDRVFKKYIISIKDMPNAEDFIETTFNSINEILMAFADRLTNYRVVAT